MPLAWYAENDIYGYHIIRLMTTIHFSDCLIACPVCPAVLLLIRVSLTPHLSLSLSVCVCVWPVATSNTPAAAARTFAATGEIHHDVCISLRLTTPCRSSLQTRVIQTHNSSRIYRVAQNIGPSACRACSSTRCG